MERMSTLSFVGTVMVPAGSIFTNRVPPTARFSLTTATTKFRLALSATIRKASPSRENGPETCPVERSINQTFLSNRLITAATRTGNRGRPGKLMSYSRTARCQPPPRPGAGSLESVVKPGRSMYRTADSEGTSNTANDPSPRFNTTATVVNALGGGRSVIAMYAGKPPATVETNGGTPWKTSKQDSKFWNSSVTQPQSPFAATPPGRPFSSRENPEKPWYPPSGSQNRTRVVRVVSIMSVNSPNSATLVTATPGTWKF